MTRWRLLSAALLLLAAFRLFSDARRLSSADRGAACREDSDDHLERGDALLQGVPLPGVAEAMPFYSVPNAVLCYHLPPAAAGRLRAAVLLVGAAAVYALGAVLYSGPSAAAAALLYALLPASAASDERWLYALTVLFAAFFLVRRARAPTALNGAALGAACGASLIVLSPLFLFPFLLVLYEWARDRKPARARDAAALCLTPFLFLIPWAVMNWRLSGRFVPFEDGRADANIITGALGFVRALGRGDARGMAGIPANRHLLAWAAGEILRHPLRYCGAYAARALLALRPHLALSAAAAVSIWLARKREDCRQLALLAGYFLAIHCLMPVQETYFTPLWPIVAVLAAGVIAGRTRPVPKIALRVSETAVGAGFAALLLAQACVLGLVWAYPARAREPQALDRALARDPGDPWFWSERGMERLGAGRAEAAAGDLARALALDPRQDRVIRYSWALLASGAPSAQVWEGLSPGPDAAILNLRARVLRAIAAALDGNEAKAAAALAEARASEARGESSLPGIVPALVSTWPPPRRAAVVEAVLGIPGFLTLTGGTSAQEADMLLNLSAAAESGGPRTAEKCLALAESLPLDRESTLRLAVAERDQGGLDRALAVLKRLEPREAEDAERFRDLALRAAQAKRWRTARESFAAAARAAGGKMDEDDARRLFAIDQEAGEDARALRLADDRIRALPGDARWRNDRGVLRALAGDRDGAAADLAAAIALDPDLLEASLSLGALEASRHRPERARGVYEKALARPRRKEDEDVARQIRAELDKLPAKRK